MNRAEAEESVRKRLNFSKRFTRGMFGLGLASGFALALSPGGHLWPDGKELTELAVLATAAPIERLQARRSADKIVADFAQANAHNSTVAVTGTGLEDGAGTLFSNLSEAYADMKEAVVPAGLNITGAIGAIIVTREIADSIQSVSNMGLRVGGGLFMATAAIGMVVDGISIDQKLSSSLLRIESIEASRK